MKNNPIVDEVHQIREKILAKFDGDLHALARDLQRRTEEARATGKAVVTRRPRSPRVATHPPIFLRTPIPAETAPPPE